MNEGAQTKVCPLCAETIKATAKVCPHCRHHQKRWSLQNQQLLAGIWVAVCIGVLGCLGVFIEKLLGPKQDFAAYRDQVAVVDSTFSFRISGSNLLLTVIGNLTNQSAVSWKNVMVEAQFFDTSGKLVDAIPADADYRGVVIMSHGEAAFRIESKAAVAEQKYITHKVQVKWAKDVEAWP